MLRYMLLAGAAAVAIPCASLAQVQWSPPLTGENSASTVMNQGGPLDSTADYDIPFNQQETTGVASTIYATDQFGPQADAGRPIPSASYTPDASDDTATAQSQPSGNGVYGSQPSGGYYFGTEGDESLTPASSQQGSYSAPPEGAYSGQPSQGYSSGGYYTSQPGGPSAYEGQGQGSYETTQFGQGLGGEGAYQQGQTTYGNARTNQGYSGGYYTSAQGSPNPSDSGAAPADTGQQGAYGGQSGYYTGQPNGQVQNYPSQDTDQASASANAQRALVIVPARIESSRQYVHKTTMANIYEMEAARIALRRAQSSDVRDYANQMLQQHQQGLAIITQAAAQAGVPQRPVLDRSHRAMLHRLATVPDSEFDRVYMSQQLVAHMRTAAVQQGYLAHGDNPVLQQAAAQLNGVVQQHLEMAMEDTGLANRLAEQRSTELAQLDQNAGRGQTYRGYTVIGPTAGNRGAVRYRNGAYRGYRGGQEYQGGQYNGGYVRGSYNGEAGAGRNGAVLIPAVYQAGGAGGAGAGGQGGVSGQGGVGGQGGAAGTGGRGAPGTGGMTGSTPGTSGYGTGAGIPGTSGYGTTTPGAGYGGPQYQGYSNPGMTTPSSPGYQNFSTPGAGTTAPGTTPGLGTTTPGTPGYQGYTPPGSTGANPGMGATAPGTPRSGSGPGG